jgi:ectoine hydroxylase-related dioxygenase (phytanoyl-CoA dioxygenase family)
MPALSPEPTRISYPTEPITRLTDVQRDELMATLQRDGFVVLPGLLPEALRLRAIEAIDRLAGERRTSKTAFDINGFAVKGDAAGPVRRSVKIGNIVDVDPVFREVMTYEPALQLAYDCFGPMFHLCQSNLVSRPRDEVVNDFVGSSPWHADGPRPALFPKIHGAMGLHYLKFGYFFTDLTHGNGGSLQVVRGSHLRPELDGNRETFRIENYAEDLVQIDCPAGSVIAFNQAQWHAAPPNTSNIERKNCYISYCPTWMRPLDREFPTEAALAGASPEERWLLGEPRTAIRWWLPSDEDVKRMSRFSRDADRAKTVKVVKYD